MATSRYLVNIFLRRQVLLERLKAGVVKKFDPTLRDIDRMIRKRLNDTGVVAVNELSRRQLNSLIVGIQKEERKLLTKYAKGLDKELKDLAYSEASFAEEALRQAVVSEHTFKRAKAAKAWAAAQTQPVQATGQLLSDFTDTWSNAQLRRIEGTLRNAHAQGWTLGDTVRSIRGTRAAGYKDGILATTTRETEAVVRTAMQHTSNAARMATYEANDDIVTGYRWISTLDSRTTSTCRSLDGRVFELGKGPLPPMHIGCRSTTVPELDGVDLYDPALGATRASKGEEGGQQVPIGQTYYDWIKNQPQAFQDATIGPTRAKLLRDGGLTSDQFARLNIGRDFQPLTLQEMRDLNPVAFDKAGI